MNTITSSFGRISNFFLENLLFERFSKNFQDIEPIVQAHNFIDPFLTNDLTRAFMAFFAAICTMCIIYLLYFIFSPFIKIIRWISWFTVIIGPPMIAAYLTWVAIPISTI